MNDNLTDITVVLDRSGSMQVVRDDTIGGFNTFLKEQQALPGEANLTLTQFDDQYEVVYEAKPIKDAPELNAETYVPRAWTALLDAIGRTMNATGKRLADMPEDERPGKVIFVILTDGEENSSKEFTKSQVLEMIKKQTDDYSWEFVFLGANQDAIQAGMSLGIQAGNSLTFGHNAQGVKCAFMAMSRGMSDYRSKGMSAQGYFNDDDRDAQAKVSTGDQADA